MGNARGFAINVSKWIREEVPAKAADIQRRITAELLTLIVQATPVGNHTKWKANVDRATRGLAPLPRGYVGGHARKNWQVTIGRPSTTVRQGTDTAGTQATSAGYNVIATLKAPGVVYISNPLPYMARLENGWSKQAPRGMVRQSVAAVAGKYARTR